MVLKSLLQQAVNRYKSGHTVNCHLTGFDIVDHNNENVKTDQRNDKIPK